MKEIKEMLIEQLGTDPVAWATAISNEMYEIDADPEGEFVEWLSFAMEAARREGNKLGSQGYIKQENNK